MKGVHEVSEYAARLARAYPNLSSYAAASLATELDAIERAQHRHAERCCSGADGGYVTFNGGRPEPTHDADAEMRAGNRIDRRLAKWTERLAELSDGGTATIELRNYPRGRVLVATFAGEAVQP